MILALFGSAPGMEERGRSVAMLNIEGGQQRCHLPLDRLAAEAENRRNFDVVLARSNPGENRKFPRRQTENPIVTMSIPFRQGNTPWSVGHFPDDLGCSWGKGEAVVPEAYCGLATLILTRFLKGP